ncbi:polysaccharide deacetylase [Lysinibacillus sphaericus]|uniref:Polysaccharide deacetylase n=1 Tax=Lysinibacillus sphaericus TaxID=1421 RepID=A0A544UQF4_LYSSH|nr:polysaccharide deacetylase family protein [Lysinibacillus sp. SDF0037]TQR36079.1 polysaccharide deacetylase [Lysinibacillus sp. SDF0037]
MKESKDKINVTKVVISLGIVLATCFFIFFLIGKFNTIPANTQQHEIKVNEASSKKVNEAPPKKQERLDGKPVGKVVYLTFDDGPTSLTSQFLEVLKEQNIKATFFMIGSNLQNTNYQENVKQAIKEGHYIGAHSMTHNSDKLYKKGQFVPEMKETLALIHDITGTNPKLVRPPYGSAPGLESKEIRNQIAESEIRVWDWTIDSRDWELKGNPNKIIENVKKQTTDDLEVVLMHEKPQTLQALPEIIKFYKEQGYEFGVYNDANHFYLNFLKDHRL